MAEIGGERKGCPLRVFISAGEASGDRQAAALVSALRQLRPEVEVWAIGGSHLEEAKAALWLDSRGAGVMGLSASLLKLPFLGPRLIRVMGRLRRQRPEVAVLVDWGGVNVRLARWLRRLGVPTLYYFPPRCWDRRAPREVAFLVDAIATPFPWSKHILSGERARVEWVGHPLIDQVRPGMTKLEAARSLGLELGRPIVALLPGSRRAEIRHCLPVLMEAAGRILRHSPETQFLIPAAEELRRMRARLLSTIEERKIKALVLEGMDYDVLQCAEAAVVVSGTATLELALLGIPMVVIYRGSLGAWLQYEIVRLPAIWQAGRTTLRTGFFSLPNLIADRAIVTELMQRQASAEGIAREVISLLSDKTRREKMREDLASVCWQLGPPGAARRAAEMVLDLAAYGSPAPLPQPVGAGSQG